MMYWVMLISHVVAPFVGAWIEIAVSVLYYECISVAPFVGAWIEIVECQKC